jgi:hypothetical protein
MRTTVRLDDRLLQRAWQEAERRGVSLASLVEQGLQLVLRVPPKNSNQRIVDRSAYRTTDVLRPSVDSNSNTSLFDQLTRGD